LWKICPINALFAKIRQNYISYKRHQRPLNRAGFCHLFYPIRNPETLPECEYEGFFSDGGFKKQGFLGYSDIISHFLNESKTFGRLVFLCFFNRSNNLFDGYSEGIDFLWPAFMLGRGLTAFNPALPGQIFEDSE
jgi:hypothetical protein